jgi:hypothetical protein
MRHPYNTLARDPLIRYYCSYTTSARRIAVAEFNVGAEEWDAIQDNGFKIAFNIRQNGTDLSGDADASTIAGAPVSSVDGDIQPGGRVSGNSFLVRVEFKNGFINEYAGDFTLDGRLYGFVTDVTAGLDSPTTSATWMSNKRFRKQ